MYFVVSSVNVDLVMVFVTLAANGRVHGLFGIAVLFCLSITNYLSSIIV